MRSSVQGKDGKSRNTILMMVFLERNPTDQHFRECLRTLSTKRFEKITYKCHTTIRIRQTTNKLYTMQYVEKEVINGSFLFYKTWGDCVEC